MSKRRTIIIAGAGVAGLAAALLLAKCGFRIVVLERAECADNAGVGIQLSPNATRILGDLGLHRRLAATGFAPESVTIKSSKLGRTLSVFTLGNSMSEQYGAPYLVLHRADLVNLLLSACNEDPEISIEYDAALEDAAIYKKGVTVMALKKGEMIEYTGGALVGADGVGSIVRSRIIGSPAAKPSGDIAWRTLIPVDRVPENISLTDTTLWMGKSGHIVCYPVRGLRQLNIVAITPQSCASDLSKRNLDIEPDAMKKFYSWWHKDVKQLLNRAESWQGWPLNQIDPKHDWTNGPCVLIGDAAHAMLPYAAQGGGAAIEDAAVLAKVLSENSDDVPAALVLYEKLRKPRVTRIWKLARSNRGLYHMGGAAAFVRNLILENTSNKSLQKRYEWLYGWQL